MELGVEISIDEKVHDIFCLKIKRNTTAVICLQNIVCKTIKTEILPTEKKVKSILENHSHQIHKYCMIALSPTEKCDVFFSSEILQTKIVLLLPGALFSFPVNWIIREQR